MGPILLADIVVTVHLAFMLFVLSGQILIVAGWLLRWTWVRNFSFRVVHLLAIVVVAAEAGLQIECPLTTLERYLRGLDEPRTCAVLAGNVVGNRSESVLTSLVVVWCADWEDDQWPLHKLDYASAVGPILCNETLYFPYNPKLFLILYTTFAVLVLLTWMFAPPRRRG